MLVSYSIASTQQSFRSRLTPLTDIPVGDVAIGDFELKMFIHELIEVAFSW